MKKLYIWLTIGLYLLVLFPRNDGRIVSLFLVELGSIYNAMTLSMTFFSIVHIVALTIFVVLGHKKTLNVKDKYFLVLSLTIQIISSILISLSMGWRQQKSIYLTSIPFWVFSLITIYYIAKIVNEKPATNTT